MNKHSYSEKRQLPYAVNRLMLSVGIVSIALITPFVISNFIQGRVIIGILTALIVLIIAANTWNISKHKRHHPKLILLGLFPILYFSMIFLVLKQGITGILWCYPVIVVTYIMLPERRARIGNAILLIMCIPLVWVSFDHALALRIVGTLLLISFFSAIFINVITDQQRKLEMRAVTDPLTGALNRALLDDILEQAVEQNTRYQIPMTLAMFDLDHFKTANDKLGHDAGDEILKGVVELIKKRCRRVDRVFRIGGEEFLLFLFNTGIENGIQVAEEIRAMVESNQIIPGHSVTLSAGVAELQSGERRKEWLKHSDDNLYQAKRIGRNCVVG